MNKTIKGLLIVALTFGAQQVQSHTNKTFLQPRNQALVNLPLERTTFQERMDAKIENRWGGNLEVVGFYGANTNKDDIGSYFGVNDKHAFNLGFVGLTPAAAVATVARSTYPTVDVTYLIHDQVLAGTTAVATNKISVKLAPESSHYGVDLVYYHNLDKVLKGLFFKINLPIEGVSNNVKFDAEDVTAPAAGAITTAEHLEDFFRGDYSVAAGDATNPQNAQAALQYGKISGKHTKTGVADIDLMLGYNFLKKETYHMGINLGLSIPTGNKPSGEYMFEPVYGTKHVGFGGGLEAGARLWGKENHNIKINFAANYRYMFEASEKRTLGLKDYNWGQYYGLIQLATKATIANTARQIIPAANILTTSVNVTPKSQFDGILGFAYNNGGFVADLGYNLYFRQAESVKIKHNPFADTTTQYGIITRNSFVNSTNEIGDFSSPTTLGIGIEGQTTVAAEVTGVITNATAVALKTSDADADAAATPSQFTNGIYAGLGYAFKEWEYPLMLGCGGKYEFASKNSVLEVWQVSAKIGVSF